MIYDLFDFGQASHPGLPAGFFVEWYLAMCCRTKRMYVGESHPEMLKAEIQKTPYYLSRTNPPLERYQMQKTQ